MSDNVDVCEFVVGDLDTRGYVVGPSSLRTSRLVLVVVAAIRWTIT
jgi:hypothetical protein